MAGVCNLVTAATVNGKTVPVALTTTGLTSILSNAAASGHTYRMVSIAIVNSDTMPRTITLAHYSAAALGGTAFNILPAGFSIPPLSTVEVLAAERYLEADQSIGATAATANTLTVTVSYDDCAI